MGGTEHFMSQKEILWTWFLNFLLKHKFDSEQLQPLGFLLERAPDHPMSDCQQAQVCPHSPLQAPWPPAGPALQGRPPQESTSQDKTQTPGMGDTASSGQRPEVCRALPADTGEMRTDSRNRAESPTFHLSVCEEVPSPHPQPVLEKPTGPEGPEFTLQGQFVQYKTHAFQGEVKCNPGYSSRNFNDLERCSQYFVK